MAANKDGTGAYTEVSTDTLGSPPTKITMNEVFEEVVRARQTYPLVHSAHHGLSIIQEEVHELMLEVYKKPMNRDKEQMRREAIQVAATAIRFAEEVC